MSLLSIKMKAGTIIVVMLRVEVEEEDVVSMTVDVKDTMDLSFINNKMEDTIMKPFLKVVGVVVVARDIVEGVVGLDQISRSRQLYECSCLKAQGGRHSLFWFIL